MSDSYDENMINNYKELFFKSPVGMFTASWKGKLIEANNSFMKILGYPDLSDLMDNKTLPEDIFSKPGEFELLVKELNKSYSVNSYETSFRKKDGKQIPVRLHLSFLDNDKDKLIAGIVEETTLQVGFQKELIHEKQTLFTLIDNLPDYIYFKNKEGALLIANKSARDLIESNNKNESLLNNELFKNDEQILATHKEVTGELIEIVDKKGYTNFISLSKYPIYHKKEFTGLIGIGKNLTELKKAEIKILQSQANLIALIESTDDFIWSVDNKLRFITFNSSFSKFISEHFNYNVDFGGNAIDVFPPKEREFWKKNYSKVLKGEQVFAEINISTEYQTFYFECSLNPIFDKKLKITGISVILADISERKLAEHAIRESEEQFRQLAENTNDSFILWDNTGVLYANPAFEKIYGISIEEAKLDFSLIERLIAEPDRDRYIKNRNKEATGRQRSRNQQYVIKRGRKSSKLVWARHYPVYNYRGKIYRYVTVTSDLTEQKQLEDVLTATRSQQQALLDNIPFLAWLKDKNGKYISVNTPFAEHYQLKQEDVIGKTDYDLLPAEKAKEIEKVDSEVFAWGEKKHFEEVYKTPHSKEWMEVYKSPIFNEKGDVIGLTGISRDITDRKRLEETIKKNEEHFRALLQYSSDAITILDKEGIITFESSLRNRILNFNVEELVGRPFQEIIHPDDVPLFKDAFNESLSNPGVQIKKEYRSLHKNKKWIYVESIFSNHLNNPSIDGVVVNTRDISDRKMSELKERAYHNNLIFLSNSALELLSLSEREDIFNYIGDKLHLFLENALILVSGYNEETDNFEVKQIAGLDRHLEELNDFIGYSLKGIEFKRKKDHLNLENAGVLVTYKSLQDYIEISEDNLKILNQVFESLNVNKAYNILLARNNKLLGGISIITLNKTIIKFKHIIETFAHQVAVALHRSFLEYELVSAKLRAEESDRLKTAFLANMSHEIRTPMNGILGFAEMLNNEKIDEEERRKYIDIINSNGKMLINLIDDIIDFAKIEAGQIKIVKHDFSLNALLSQVYNTFLSDNFKRDKSDVKLRLRKGLIDKESYIRTDPIRLRQIITNLIGNAFKFTTQGYIEFGYRINDTNEIEFFVEDTGIGINPEKLDQIFERFVQADNSRSRKYSGSGLGLAISKGFSELLGGKMWAKSEMNEGSTFYFTIPYEPAKRILQDDSDQKKPKSDYNWSNKRILVAEDDFFSYKFLEGFLKQTKADVLHAEDGSKALEICTNDDAIDVVLMDIQMPEMNGMDATRNIKKFRNNLPIIAQTANAIAEEKQRCFEAGFDDFVTKPINISELFMKIEYWMVKSGKTK